MTYLRVAGNVFVESSWNVDLSAARSRLQYMSIIVNRHGWRSAGRPPDRRPDTTDDTKDIAKHGL